MAPHPRTLPEKARATCELLIQGLLRGFPTGGEDSGTGLVEAIHAAYLEACRTTLARFGVQAKELRDEQLRRLSFEVLCFAAEIIMGQEAPRFVVETAPDEQDDEEVEEVRRFNEALLEWLQKHWNVIDRATSRGPVDPAPRGEAPAIAERIADYLSCRSAERRIQLFGQHVAFALDIEAYVALKIIGAELVEPIIALTRLVLKMVFRRGEAGA